PKLARKQRASAAGRRRPRSRGGIGTWSRLLPMGRAGTREDRRGRRRDPRVLLPRHLDRVELGANLAMARPVSDERLTMPLSESDMGRAIAYDYELPKEQIAQRPAEPRDSARLLAIRDDEIEHLRFSDFPSLLRSG